MIFVDTTYWIALCNKSDPLNMEAIELLEDHENDTFITTELVRGEVWDHLTRAVGFLPARAFVEILDRSARTRVLTVSRAVQTEAMQWLHEHGARHTFVCATSYVIMRAMRIRRVLAFRASFEQAGFDCLRG